MPLRKDLTVPSTASEANPQMDLGLSEEILTSGSVAPMTTVELCAKVQQELSPSVREACFIELLKIGGEEVVEGLLPLLRSDDVFLRNKVIETLRELPNEIAPHMEALLADPDSDVRIFAINVLEALRHPKVESWLIFAVLNDVHPNVVGAALDLLAEVGTTDCVDALHAVSVRFPAEPYLEFAARTALKRIEASQDV